MKIGFHETTESQRPYIIAEIGVNHGGCIETAKKLILLAKEGGANAAKFQTYKADKIAIKNSPAYWDITKEQTKSQHELFKKYDSFNEDDYRMLADFCRSNEIDFLSTPFDLDAVDFLDDLMPFYKIASADLTNIPMLRKVANKGKPIVLSTGASTKEEISIALEILKKAGAVDVTLLHCILNYPTDNKNANLNMIDDLKKTYPSYEIGYSDHTLPDERMLVLTTAWLKGAKILEKHFTHDKTLKGNDHYHAMDMNDLKKFCENVEFILLVNGNEKEKGFIPEELPAREHARRSIVSLHSIRAGDKINESHLICKRPAHGISPLEWDEVIGSVAACDIQEDTPLKWEDLIRS